MVTVRLARMAMACRFELVLQGEDEPWLRAAGEEALREIERLESQLSIFLAASDVSRINARAGHEAVRVEARLFRLLQRCHDLHRVTDGAFDLTVAPLMQAWGFYREGGRMPDPAELASARRRTGMHLVELDEANRSVRFLEDGVRLDFGAVGKGYAVDEAVRILREAGVERAFLHGGTSTMYGLGRPLEAPSWKVAIPHPAGEDRVLAAVPLTDESLSVSAVWGKSFEAKGEMLGHVLDPRTGSPVRGAVLAAAAGASATDADAVSTALLVRGCARPVRPLARMRSIVVGPRDERGRHPLFNGGITPYEASKQELDAAMHTSVSIL